MKTTYTFQEILSYLSKYYLIQQRSNNVEFFYNCQNRNFVPLPLGKETFTKTELVRLWSQPQIGIELPIEEELIRLNQFCEANKI
jgi:hypothetical protein